MQDIQLVPQMSLHSPREGQQSEASPPSKWPTVISEVLNVPGGHGSCSEGSCRHIMSATPVLRGLQVAKFFLHRK